MYCPRCKNIVENIDKCCFCRLARPYEGWSDSPECDFFLSGGRYNLVSPISIGGFGVTMKAVQYIDGNSLGAVAVKFPVEKDEFDGDFRVFIEEAIGLRRVSHQNIAKLFDAFIEEGTPYIVMEFVEGDLLSGFYYKEMKLAQKLEIGAQISHAVSSLHAKGILHCDLKPDNILMQYNWYDDEIFPTFVKIIDFGLSVLWKHREKWMLRGAGTPGYSAPEQFLGYPSPQSDVFSVGVIMYELLAGDIPYNPDLSFCINDFLECSIPPLPESIPLEIKRVIYEAIEPDVKKRTITIIKFRDEMIRLSNIVRLESDWNEVENKKYDLLIQQAKEEYIAGVKVLGNERKKYFINANKFFSQAELIKPLPVGLQNSYDKTKNLISENLEDKDNELIVSQNNEFHKRLINMASGFYSYIEDGKKNKIDLYKKLNEILSLADDIGSLPKKYRKMHQMVIKKINEEKKGGVWGSIKDLF
mgnify:CR=1 FL=1